MEWAPLKYVLNFDGAEAVFRSGDWVIALWDHSECRGWQVYKFDWRGQPRWLAGAGVESVEWTDGQAQRWAEQVIAQSPGGADRKP
jgi:hypothetical protein